MALVVGTDTYVSVAEATTYFAGQLGAAAWASAAAGEQENALRMACARLDAVHYQGAAAAAGQALKWPRSGLVDGHSEPLSSAAVPQFVKDAQCWEGLFLLQWAARGAGDGERERLRAQGVLSVKLGDVAETFGPQGAAGLPALGPMAWAILGPYVAWSPGRVVL